MIRFSYNLSGALIAGVPAGSGYGGTSGRLVRTDTEYYLW